MADQLKTGICLSAINPVGGLNRTFCGVFHFAWVLRAEDDIDAANQY